MKVGHRWTDHTYLEYMKEKGRQVEKNMRLILFYIIAVLKTILEYKCRGQYGFKVASTSILKVTLKRTENDRPRGNRKSAKCKPHVLCSPGPHKQSRAVPIHKHYTLFHKTHPGQPAVPLDVPRSRQFLMRNFHFRSDSLWHHFQAPLTAMPLEALNLFQSLLLRRTKSIKYTFLPHKKLWKNSTEHSRARQLQIKLQIWPVVDFIYKLCWPILMKMRDSWRIT